MASKDDDATERMRKAAEEGRITYAETDEIENYDEIARELLQEIFDIDYDDCFISDESALSDFATCCCPDEVGTTLEEAYAAGKAEMKRRILARYGIDVDPHELLITVFEQIRRQQIAPRS